VETQPVLQQQQQKYCGTRLVDGNKLAEKMVVRASFKTTKNENGRAYIKHRQ
jgi:hypothetical protein